MNGITVIVVPTWAVWAFIGFAVANIAQHLWKIALLRKQARHEPPNVRAKRATTAGRAGQQAQNGAEPQRLMTSVACRWRSA
jgi:hypothetical protein